MYVGVGCIVLAIVTILVCDEARCSGVSLTDSYLVEELRYRDQIVTRLHTVMAVCLACTIYVVQC